MTASAAEYAWVAPWMDSVSQAYCLTLARGLSPEQFLARLGAEVETSRRVGTELSAPSFEVWDAYEGDRLFVGATTVRGNAAEWVLGLEVNGYLGVTPTVMVPVSAGTRVVSHYRNVEAVDRFCWMEDGDERLSFSPAAPAWREGSMPDALTDVMRTVGFDLRPDVVDGAEDMRTEAGFALAEHLTGVRLTRDVLDRSIYLCGVAPVTPPVG